MTPQHRVSYSLKQDETLELKTTTNLLYKTTVVSFNPPPNSAIFLNFMCVDLSLSKWAYVIKGCMYNSYVYDRIMDGVPSDEIKIWQITRTSTSLVVVCNGVTVLNFNFATDYRDGYSSCYESWRHSTAIQFYHSREMYGDSHLYGDHHLFMRIERHG